MFDDLKDMGNKIFKRDNSFYVTYGGASLLMSIIMNFYKNNSSQMRNRMLLH